MDRYDHYTDKFITDLHDTQYGILGTNLAEAGTMTNAEAIDVIRDYLVNKVDNEPMQKACQLAIKALSAEPQIIRCRDCAKEHWCKFTQYQYQGENGFCSLAERRTDEEVQDNS